jgi:Putative collagen-binding domain of a collagenase
MYLDWHDPGTGEVIKIGVAETRERYGIDPPSEEDWVLVFYDHPLNIE